ncbi:zinc-ribbon domain-containing protein [Lentilactobacillus kisonensis]
MELKSKCPVCGELVSVKDRFCSHCGAKLQQRELTPNSTEENAHTK